eukprot:7717832-Pyramimonas_sp.AAC.1
MTGCHVGRPAKDENTQQVVVTVTRATAAGQLGAAGVAGLVSITHHHRGEFTITVVQFTIIVAQLTITMACATRGD